MNSERADPRAEPSANPDLILLGGRVHTVDLSDQVVEAIAIGGSRIVAVGSSKDLRALAGPGTRLVDLAGRSVLPGFIESHNHMGTYGTQRMGIDCRSPDLDSIEALKTAIRERASRTPPGQWIHARGYNETRLAERRHPNRSDLDQAAPEHPVFLGRTCGHIAAVNSQALERAGIVDGTPDPEAGRYERENGRLTGVVYEAAQGPLLAAAALSRAELREALGIANRDWLRAGITSAHDAGAKSSEQLSALLDCVRDGSVRVRVYFMVWLALGMNQGFTFLESGLYSGFGNDKIRLGPFKIMVDGASSGPTAGTRQDYTSEPGNRGIVYYQQDELNAIVERAHSMGYQVTAHAVGDRAIEMFLDAIERALLLHPRADHRHRIEHCAICPPDLVERIAHLGVIPVIQPAFFWDFGDGYLQNYGSERAAQMFPARSMRSARIVAAGSSDAPVTDVRPLFGIQQAMTRATLGGAQCGVAETLELAEALRLFTINGAYASFDEQVKGSLEPGKFADLVVLDGCIETTPPHRIADIPIAATLIDGVVEFGAL